MAIFPINEQLYLTFFQFYPVTNPRAAISIDRQGKNPRPILDEFVRQIGILHALSAPQGAIHLDWHGRNMTGIGSGTGVNPLRRR